MMMAGVKILILVTATKKLSNYSEIHWQTNLPSISTHEANSLTRVVVEISLDSNSFCSVKDSFFTFPNVSFIALWEITLYELTISYTQDIECDSSFN